MKIELPDSCCLTEDAFTKLARSTRNLLLERKKVYRGEKFEEELSEVSGLPADRIRRVLEADDTQIGCALNGLDWEHLLSATRILPERLLVEAGIEYTEIKPSPRTKVGVGEGGSITPPPEAADFKIRVLFDAMSDFFLVASMNCKEA